MGKTGFLQDKDRLAELPFWTCTKVVQELSVAHKQGRAVLCLEAILTWHIHCSHRQGGSTTRKWTNVESDSEGKVIVSVIARKNVHMNTCLILNGYRDRAVWIYKYKSIVNDNKEREITYC